MRKKIVILGIILLILLGLAKVLFLSFRPPAGRTNLLILGIAGKGYTGEDLTDTILFASIDNHNGKILLLSLPRDIWIPEWRTKLNSIYHYKGLDETKATVAEIIGQKIDYGVIIDLNLFRSIINYLDGVEVDIERSFDDYKYPIAGKENDLCNGDSEYQCRYEHLHFDSGRQYLDGEKALRYIRSRNAEGEEGTDFSRSQRQQKILQAITEKITSPKFFLQPGKAWGLFKLVRANIKTDISGQDYLKLLKLGLRFKRKNLQTISLNGDLFINPKTNARQYDNQWVLIPKSGSWKEIRDYISSRL